MFKLLAMALLTFPTVVFAAPTSNFTVVCAQDTSQTDLGGQVLKTEFEAQVSGDNVEFTSRTNGEIQLQLQGKVLTTFPVTGGKVMVVDFPKKIQRLYIFTNPKKVVGLRIGTRNEDQLDGSDILADLVKNNQIDCKLK